MRFIWNIHLYIPTHNCGSELMAHQINKFLISQGHEVRVILNQANQHNITKTYEIDGVIVTPAGKNKEDLIRMSDVILTHLDFSHESIYLGKRFKKRVVQFVHNSHPYQSVIENPEVEVVYNSNWIKDELGYNNRSFVFEPPCDYRYYDVNPDKINSEYITLINLDGNKGGEVLQKIAAALPDKKFLGVMGSYSEPAKLGQVTNQPANVKVIPNTPEIRDVYKQTRILIMPSVYESWGRTATEAMCSGIPVIASRTRGLNENLGKAGLFVDDRDDVDAWVRWIKRLDDKKFYSQVSKMAKERSRELDPINKLVDLNKWLINR